MKGALAVLVAWALMGSITLTYASGTTSAATQLVEVRLGALAAGSAASSDHAEGTASVAGVLVSARTNLLYLNNTNATGAWYVKIAQVSTSGISNVVSLAVGIDNGTASTPQVTGALGALTQTEGSYVRLEPASTNRIYVTQAVSLVGPDTALALDIYAADTAAADAYVITNANLTIT